MLLNGDHGDTTPPSHGDTTPPSHGMLVFEQTATENVWNDVYTWWTHAHDTIAAVAAHGRDSMCALGTFLWFSKRDRKP